MPTNSIPSFKALSIAMLLASASLSFAQTMPPPGGTPPPDSSPPPAGTPTPPTPGTPTPPTPPTPTPPTPPAGSASTSCFIAVPGVPIPAGAKPCEFSIPVAGGTQSDPKSFFSNVSETQLAGMNADQLKNFDPKSASGFNATQLGALSPNAVGGMNADLLKNLAPTAVNGLKDNQVAALQPEALKGMTPDQLQNLSPDAMRGFTPEQLAEFLPAQLNSFTPQQFAKLDAQAVGGMTPDQFKALPGSTLGTLDTGKLAALDGNVFKTLEKDKLAALDPAAVKALDPKELAEMVVNLDKQKLAPADVKNLLPPGWAIDDKTGKVTPPAGAEVTLRTAAQANVPTGLSLPSLPDLNSGLALGGDNAGGSVLDGMVKALEKAGLPGFDMTQSNGVLNVFGTGANANTKLAFIPDADEIKQAPAGTQPGLSKNAQGAFVLTTPDGMQVPVIPALSSPENLVKAVPGAKIAIQDTGSTTITPPNSTTAVVGIPDPFLQKSTLAPGIHTEGTGANKKVTVVYPDGTAQTLKPTVQDLDELKEATKVFPQITDVSVGADGTLKLVFNGQTVQVKPDFDLQAGTGTSGAPKITPVGNGVYRFTNSKGQSQDLYLGG